MSRSSPPSKRLARLLLATLLRASLIQVVSASIFSDPVLSYCKCICFQNSTIIPLFRPTDPSKPCLSCTRQFCLDQKLGICKDAQVPELDTDVGTGTEGDVEARCFKRDSPRDQLIVTFFLLIVMGLLLFAAIRSRLRKAIEERGRPTDMREWGQALLPGTLHPILDKVPGTSRRSRGGSGGFGDSDMRDGSGGRYAPVSVGS